MTTTTAANDYTLADTLDLIALAGVQITEAADLDMLKRAVAHIGDPGLAADALLMVPRLEWLHDLIGDALTLTR